VKSLDKRKGKNMFHFYVKMTSRALETDIEKLFDRFHIRFSGLQQKKFGMEIYFAVQRVLMYEL
jgi:hypothetical protein